MRTFFVDWWSCSALGEVRGKPGRLEVWEGVTAPLRRTPRAWERVEVGAAGWTGGGAVVEGVAIAEPGWITRAEGRLSARKTQRLRKGRVVRAMRRMT